MGEIIKINPRPRYITVEEDYIKTLKEIIKNYKDIEEAYKIQRDNLITVCNGLITTAMQGDYGEDDEKVMQELRELNKFLMKFEKQ